MAKTKALLDCIKQELRQKGITYRHLAENLGMTESGVKHMFSVGNFTLERLDQIAASLEMEMSDLVALTVDRAPKLERLTLEQEQEIVRDRRLFVVAYAAINYWRFDDILSRYRLSESELVKILVQLEKMGVLTLHVNNRITPRIANNFSWHPDGPIEHFFREEVLPQFFAASFDEHDAIRIVKNGELTEQSRQLLVRRIDALGEYFDELCFNDRKEALYDRRTGTSLVMGVRAWQFSSFADLSCE